MIYLNVGCGNKRLKGNVINLDKNRDAVWEEGRHTVKTKIDVQADCRFLPFRTNVFDGIIARQIVEHLPREQHEFVIREWRRVLKYDGAIIVEVPDLEKVCKYYFENYLGERDNYWYDCIYGRRSFPGDEHVSGLTHRSLTDLLLENGYHNLDWTIYWDEKEWQNMPYMAVFAKKTKMPQHRMGYDSTLDIMPKMESQE